MAEYTNNDVAMSWDDIIENDDEFIVLPEGDYDFTVVDYERKRFEGSTKMSACPKAEVSIKIYDINNPSTASTIIKENLLLNRKMEWKLCQFFTAIGLRKHGEALKMNWNNVKGKTGRCKVIINKYINSQGEEKENNRIDKFYNPDETPTSTPVQKKFVPGQF